jgi:hypothetical protein
MTPRLHAAIYRARRVQRVAATLLVIAAFAAIFLAPATVAAQSMSRDFYAGDTLTPTLPAVRNTVDRASMTYAERVRVHLIVIASPLDRITWPSIGDELSAAGVATFRVASITEPTPIVVDNTPPAQLGELVISLRRTLTLEPLIADKHDIPAFDFVITPDAAAKKAFISTQPIPIQVRSVLPDSAATTPPTDPGEMRGIAPIAPDRDWTPVFVGVAAAATVGLLGFIGVRLMRRRPAKAHSPREVANYKLARLYNSDGSLAVTPTVAMRVLDDVLRDYLVATFSLKQGERTTLQLQQMLAAHPSAPLDEITRTLEQFDVAKFAGKPAHDADVKAARDDVEALIAMTQAEPVNAGGSSNAPPANPSSTQPSLAINTAPASPASIPQGGRA